MNVVAASVHHRYLVAVQIGGGDRAGVRQPGLFSDRQGVHVGPQQHGGSVTVVQHPDHAGAADTLVHLVAEAAEPRGHLGGGVVLLVRQLRVLVQVAVEVLLPPSGVVQATENAGNG